MIIVSHCGSGQPCPCTNMYDPADNRTGALTGAHELTVLETEFLYAYPYNHVPVFAIPLAPAASGPIFAHCCALSAVIAPCVVFHAGALVELFPGTVGI